MFLQNNMLLRKRNSYVVNILYTILHDFFFNNNSDDEYMQNYTAVSKVLKCLCRVSNKIYFGYDLFISILQIYTNHSNIVIYVQHELLWIFA